MSDSPESSDHSDDEPVRCCWWCRPLYSALGAPESTALEEPCSRQLPALQLPADASGSRSPETPSSLASLVSLGAFVLSADYDPEREYVRHYAVGGYDGATVVTTTPQSGRFVMRDNSFNKSAMLENRAFLDAAVTGAATISPRDIARRLERLALKIRLECNLETRGELILEYEQYKDALDRDNAEDAERARYFLGDARNQRLEQEARLGYYRKAVQFTNELSRKEALRKEYYEFCHLLRENANL